MRWLFQLVMSFAITAIATGGLADAVSVNRGTGMGYAFTHRGNCYMFMPQHVHGRQTQVSVRTAGSAVGNGVVFYTFAPGVDLSVAYVAGLENDCASRWGELPADLRTMLPTIRSAQLVRVDATGRETRDEMTIVAFDHQTITAHIADPSRESEIRKGTSGSILKAGDVVLGMAIESADTGEALFLRTDEIVSRLTRLLDPGPVPELPAVPQATTASCPQGGLTIKSVSCSAEPISPEYACTNLMAGGPVIFPPGTRPQIVIDLDGTQAPGVVTMGTSSESGTEAIPKSVRIESTSVTRGAPRWRRFGDGDMSPAGALAIHNGARPYATRLAITLESSWKPDLPLRLDCVAAR